MTDFEKILLDELKSIKEDINIIKEDIEEIKENSEITRESSNHNGIKLEALIKELRDLQVVSETKY
ncbi:MAG: hypothetical protein J5992_00580 [Oscillospiraceae bacterium]|nr:hypothetical protein [Oscillospiraceae bacterium]